MNIGTYFDGEEQADDKDTTYVYSRTITDHIWNYAYRRSQLPWDDESLHTARELAVAHGREPAVWQLGTNKPLSGWNDQGQEAWMVSPLEAIPESNVDGLDISIRDKPDEEMIAVFNDAYSSEVGEDEVGYFALPPEYGSAYSNGEPGPGVAAYHLAGLVDGVCVSIATLFVVGGVAGLYAVATRPTARRHGYGRAISAAALAKAREEGASSVLLQTDAGSPVEEMYASLGFKTQFIGSLFTYSSG